MPSTPTNDVDLYCTHSDLVDELGSARKLAKLVPPDSPSEPESADLTKPVREQSLRDVLKALRRKTPPILEAQISDPTQIKDAIAYGALMRLYRAAMTGPDDVNAELFRHFKKRFESELGGLNLTVDNGAVAPTSVKVWRS